MGNLRIGDGKDWTFMHGEWMDGLSGELIPPDGFDVEYMAVRSDEAYADFSATFRFKFRWGFGGARLLFRVQDSRRFYALDIPICGQQWRCRHFWAGLVVADGTSLQRYLNFALVPGLCAKYDWYNVRVEAKGPRLRAWIEDILVADVEDHTYESGRIGLAGITSLSTETPHFADLCVEGSPVPPDDWPGLVPPVNHWINPCPVIDPDTNQGYANMIQSKSGALTVYLIIGNPNWGEIRRAVYLRSNDAGRTWSDPEPSTLKLGLGSNFTRKDGTWVCMFPNFPPTSNAMPWDHYSYESTDEGRTWKGANELKIKKPPEGWGPASPMPAVRMRDGSIVVPFDCSWPRPPELADEFLAIGTTFMVRSEDDGHTWSDPVRCDANAQKPDEEIPSEGFLATLAGSGGESRWAEVRENVLMGICRPGKDPYMVKRQSNDGGRTWEPASTNAFPGYCPSLTATENGAVVATTRFPHFAAHLSRDGGRNWDPPVIVDYAQWANQTAFLGEPDTVVVSYMGQCFMHLPGQPDSRIARLKVTDSGLVLDH